MYVAEVVARNSMSVSDYIEKTEFDPVLQYSKTNHDDTFDTSFTQYLERNRAWLQNGEVTHPIQSIPEGKSISNE